MRGAGPALPLAFGVDEGGISPLSMLLLDRRVMATALPANSYGAASPTPLPTESALLCCPGKVRGLLALVLQLVGDTGNSLPL